MSSSQQFIEIVTGNPLHAYLDFLVAFVQDIPIAYKIKTLKNNLPPPPIHSHLLTKFESQNYVFANQKLIFLFNSEILSNKNFKILRALSKQKQKSTIRIGVKLFDSENTSHLLSIIISELNHLPNVSFDIKFFTSSKGKSRLQEQLRETSSLATHNIYNRQRNANICLNRFLCYKCLKIPVDPVVSRCCHDIYCQECVFSCRKCDNLLCVDTVPFVTKTVEQMQYQCVCGKQIIMKEYKRHLERCKVQFMRCKVYGCGFEGGQNDYARHLVESHSDLVLINLDAILARVSEQENQEYECSKCGSFYQKKQYDLPYCGVCHQEFI